MARPILLIEDDNGIRDMLSDCLADAGYHTVEASNGQVALSLLHNGLEPQLILLDLMMPMMNGHEFLSAWRANASPASAPVVVLTADQREQEQANHLGVAAVLTKPMQLDNLLSVVARWAQPGAESYARARLT